FIFVILIQFRIHSDAFITIKYAFKVLILVNRRLLGLRVRIRIIHFAFFKNLGVFSFELFRCEFGIFIVHWTRIIIIVVRTTHGHFFIHISILNLRGLLNILIPFLIFLVGVGGFLSRHVDIRLVI